MPNLSLTLGLLLLGDILQERKLLKGVAHAFIFGVRFDPLSKRLSRRMDFRQRRRIQHLFCEKLSGNLCIGFHNTLLVKRALAAEKARTKGVRGKPAR